MTDPEILALVAPTDPVLRQPAQPFDFANPQRDPVELAHALTRTMIAHRGLGLAAPQVGVSLRAFVMTGDPVRAFFNPVIVHKEGELDMEEGCLTYPGMVLKVKRPAMVRVRYTQPNGEVVTERYQGLTARIIHHEVDHLDGFVFLDRVSRFHRDRAVRKFTLAKRRARVA